MTTSYWVRKDQFLGIVEDISTVQYPLPDEWSIYTSEAPLEGDPSEYHLEDGVPVRKPPYIPTALERAMSTDPIVLDALTRIRKTSAVAALLVQLVVAHLEQNLKLAEDALASLPEELKKDTQVTK